MSRCDYCDTPIDAATCGTDSDGMRACFQCCAWLDVMTMREGKAPGLYRVSDTLIQNWPGTLTLRVISAKKGRHNMAGSRTTVRFIGPDGSVWSGVEYHGPSSGNLLRGVRKLQTVRA